MSSWYERIIDCYGENNMEENYQKITDNRLDELKNKYNFDYVILYNKTETMKMWYIRTTYIS